MLFFFQPKSTDVLFLISPQKICCGYSLEASPHFIWVSQHIFLWRNKKEQISTFWLKKKTPYLVQCSTSNINSSPAESSPAFANSVDPDQLASEEAN